jgi:hypothetical protein
MQKTRKVRIRRWRVLFSDRSVPMLALLKRKRRIIG